MKMLTVILLFSVSSCGKFATRDQLKATDDRIDSLEARVKSLETDFNSLYVSLQNVQNDVNLNHQDLVNSSTIIQDSLDTIQQQLTELQMQDSVTEMIDPCPDPYFTGYAEVLMLTKSGKYIAYFESGAKRHLTVLKKNQNYTTTDTRGCNFKINNNNQIEVF